MPPPGPSRTTCKVLRATPTRALSHLIMEAVPADPGRDEFRQGNTLGTAYRHWRRAKIGRRFRLFFRYDSRSKVIVYAWVNDENTLGTTKARVWRKWETLYNPQNNASSAPSRNCSCCM
jgi:Toxin with endonuclease activity, of toxin-antitoxin system